MYKLLKGNSPSKTTLFHTKISAEPFSLTTEFENNELDLYYIVTKTREILHVLGTTSENGETKENILASIYVTRQTLHDVNGYKIQVYGDYEKFSKYISLINSKYAEEPMFTLEELGFTISTSKKFNSNKLKDIEYDVLEQEYELDLSNYASIEDYLYKNNTIEEMLAEANEKKQKKIDALVRKYGEENVDTTFEPSSLEWTNQKNYKILRTKEEIDLFIEGLANTNEIVGFDTETTGLLVGVIKYDYIVGLSMSYEDNCGYYFPINHKRIPNMEYSPTEFIEKLRPYIDARSETKKDIVTHNGGFDWKVLKQFDIQLNIVHDTFIRFGLMDIAEAKSLTGALKPMVAKFLGIDVLDLDKMYKPIKKEEIKAIKKAVFDFNIPINETTKYKLERIDFFHGKDATLPFDFRFASEEFSRIYGSADADFPRILFKIQEQQWDNMLNTVYRLEIASIATLGEQEYYGIKTNAEALLKMNEETKVKVAEIEKEIFELTGGEFNINSSVQLAEVLYDKMECPFLPRFRTKSGGRSTDKNVLNYLANQKEVSGEPKYPIATLLKQHSKYSQLISSFYGKIPQLVHGGRIFPSYLSLGTETGRISANRPNVQQVEPTVRPHMTVDDENEYYMMICDYSQVEYRIMGGLSNERKIVDFFKQNPEADYHILAYANMHGIPYESVTPKQRKEGKILNFGTTYGLEDEKLAENLYGATTELHKKMANDARKKYFAGIPVLRDYFESVRDQSMKDKYVTTLFNRKRWIPEFKGQDVSRLSEYTIASGRRKAGNTPVQGTAADIQKLAMYRIRKNLTKYGLTEDEAHLVLNVHDETAVQFHKSIHPYFALYIMREAMEMDLSKHNIPPLYIGAIIGTSWGSGQLEEREMPVMLMDEICAKVEKENIRTTDMSVEDSVDMWIKVIQDFAIRQIKFEYDKANVNSIDECFALGRAKTYSDYFEDNEDAVRKLVFDKDIDDVRENYLNYLENAEYKNYKFTPSVQKISTDDVVTVQGQEILETDSDEMNRIIKEHLQYNESDNSLTIKFNYADTELAKVIESSLVNYDAYHFDYMFKPSQKYLRTTIILSDSTMYTIQNRGLLSGMLPLIKYYLRTHLFGIGNYINSTHKIEKVCSNFVA